MVQNPLILAQESKWNIINNILEPEEGKSIKYRFPYPFIHLNLWGQAASSVFEYKFLMLCQLSSMKPFLFWSGPSSQTLLASNHFHTGGGGGGTPIWAT